jgi:hypothetical protein
MAVVVVESKWSISVLILFSLVYAIQAILIAHFGFHCMEGEKYEFKRRIFQTFWKPDCCTKSLFLELETFNFDYLLVFFLISFNCAKFLQDWSTLILDIL